MRMALRITFGIALFLGSQAQASDSGFRLKILLNQEVKTQELGELRKLKQVASRERDPASGRLVQFRGVLLSAVVDEALKGVGADKKAQIDLIVLKNAAGKQALVPRAFLSKYPMMLALSRDGGELGDLGPLYSVAPWTTHEKTMKKEGFALATFFLPGVTQLEFANSRERFSGFYLKRRTDPKAMRGERIFVQTCVSCHSAGPGPSVVDLSTESHSRQLASGEHPPVQGYPEINEGDRKALVSYLNAYRSENSAGGVGGSSTALKPASASTHAQD